MVLQGFPGSSDSKESPCNAGDVGSILGLGRSLEEGMVTHSSILAWRIPMDRGGAWQVFMGLQRVTHMVFGKDLDSGKEWRQKKRVRQDEMVGWHHQFSGHELGQTPGDGEKQGSLACCSPRGRRVRHNLATGQQQWSPLVKYKNTTACRGCTHRTIYTRHTGTNLCDWTCQRMFSSLKVCSLKVCMYGTYCIMESSFDRYFSLLK